MWTNIHIRKIQNTTSSDDHIFNNRAWTGVVISLYKSIPMHMHFHSPMVLLHLLILVLLHWLTIQTLHTSCKLWSILISLGCVPITSIFDILSCVCTFCVIDFDCHKGKMRRWLLLVASYHILLCNSYELFRLGKHLNTGLGRQQLHTTSCWSCKVG